MNIKQYLTSEVKLLLIFIIFFSIIFTITAILIAIGEVTLIGFCLLVTSFIAIPVLIGALISILCQLHEYYHEQDSTAEDAKP